MAVATVAERGPDHPGRVLGADPTVEAGVDRFDDEVGFVEGGQGEQPALLLVGYDRRLVLIEEPPVLGFASVGRSYEQ